MESYHVPRGPKKGIWFADRAYLEQFLAVAQRDAQLAPQVAEWQAALMLQGTGTTAIQAGPANMPLNICTEDDLTILRSGVAAIIDVWNYGVDSKVAAARKPDLDRITAAMFRRQARAAKKQKWNA